MIVLMFGKNRVMFNQLGKNRVMQNQRLLILQTSLHPAITARVLFAYGIDWDFSESLGLYTIFAGPKLELCAVSEELIAGC